MKKIYLVILLALQLFCLTAQTDELYFSPGLSEKMALHPQMTLQEVADKLYIPIEDFKTRFNISLRDTLLNSSPLQDLEISIFDV